MTTQLDRIEAKLDLLVTNLIGASALEALPKPSSAGATPFPTPATGAAGAGGARPNGSKPSVSAAELDAYAVLRGLTVKQHAALQMILGGKTNEEIAQRFGVTVNTAKVYVRSIARKLGVRTRAQIVMRLTHVFVEIPDDQYRLMAGGLPKDWDQEFAEPDPFVAMYRKPSNDRADGQGGA